MSLAQRLLQVPCTIDGERVFVDAPGAVGLRQLAWRMFSTYAVAMAVIKWVLVGTPFTPALLTAIPMAVMAVVRGVLMAREHVCEGADLLHLGVEPTGRQIASVRLLITLLSALGGFASGVLALIVFPLGWDAIGISLVAALTLWEGLMGAVRVADSPIGTDWKPAYRPVEAWVADAQRVASSDSNEDPHKDSEPAPPAVPEFGPSAGPLASIDPQSEHAEIDFSPAPELTRQQDESEAPDTIISTPADLAEWVTRWGRVRLRKHRIPTDVFVWDSRPSHGQPVTRFGGLPHRPQDRAWPVRTDGRPMRFVMQWSFLDSADILDAPLPGAVLCLFDDTDPERPSDSIGSEFKLEWNAAGIDGVCTEAPSGCRLPFEFTGVRSRVQQSPDTKYPGTRYEHCELQATLVGSHCFWPQGNHQGHRVLCAFSEIGFSNPWPTVDRESLLSTRAFAQTTPLSLHDAGVLIVFQRSDGSLGTELQSY